jgi:RNA polymerase sigma-70 factor (ECF subfamily)
MLAVLTAKANDAESAGARAIGMASFEALYRANVSRVYALCARLCADRALAEHLTQDAFVRAWERRDDFRGESSFATWVSRIAVTVVLDERRARARRERRVVADDDAVSGAASAPPSSDEGLDLERAIARLPEGARTVLVLHDVEGYRHDEIATLLGVAEGTSKAHLHRARSLLREVLG